MAGFFRETIAVRFMPNSKRRLMFVQFAERNESDRSFMWDDGVTIALSQIEVAELFGSVRKFNLTGKAPKVTFYHDMGKGDYDSNDVKVFTAGVGKDRDGNLHYVIKIMLNPKKSKKTGKTKADFVATITLTNAEALLLENIMQAFLFESLIPTLQFATTASESADEDEIEETDEFDDLEPETEEADNDVFDDEEDEPKPKRSKPKASSNKSRSTGSRKRKTQKKSEVVDEEEEEVDEDDIDDIFGD